MNSQRETVRHAVGHAEKFNPEVADLHRLARCHAHQPVRRIDPVFVELWLDERQRQRRPVHRSVDERQHVRHCPNVILVAVGQDQGRQAPLERLEIGQIGDDQIHAGQLRLGEHDARVDKDGRFAIGEDHHVHAEFPDAAEGYHLEPRRGGCGRGHSRSH